MPAPLHQVPLVGDDDDAARRPCRPRRRWSRPDRWPLRSHRSTSTATSACSMARRATTTLTRFDLAGARHPARPADAGGVEDPERPLVPLEQRVDGVPGRPGHVADDRSLLAQQPLSSDDLPTFGRPTMATAVSGSGRPAPRPSRRGAGSRATISSSRSPTPVAVLGGDLDDRLEAQAVELDGPPRARRSSVLFTAMITGRRDRRAAPRRSPRRPAPAPRGRPRRRQPGRPSPAPCGRARRPARAADRRWRRTSRRCRPAKSGCPATRPAGRSMSRVVPATGVTMARRESGDAVEQRGLADVRAADQHDRRDRSGTFQGHVRKLQLGRSLTA